MSDLIKSLEDALNEVAYIGNDKALRIIENALRQAYRLSNEQPKQTSSEEA
tara:strand:- start:5207 stop:5359 length:153 start_codon:yes stop_codon:yes gene_type:complete